MPSWSGEAITSWKTLTPSATYRLIFSAISLPVPASAQRSTRSGEALSRPGGGPWKSVSWFWTPRQAARGSGSQLANQFMPIAAPPP